MSIAYSYYTIPGLDSKPKGLSIIDAVNKVFKVVIKWSFLKQRKTIYVDARRIAIFLLITIDNHTFTSAAAIFEKDHSTASYSMRKCQALFQSDPAFRKSMFEVFELIKLPEETQDFLKTFLKSDMKWNEFKKLNQDG